MSDRNAAHQSSDSTAPPPVPATSPEAQCTSYHPSSCPRRQHPHVNDASDSTMNSRHNSSVMSYLTDRAIGRRNPGIFESSVASHFIPNHTLGMVADYGGAKCFVGRLTADGSVFVSACQDRMIRLYHVDRIYAGLLRQQARRRSRAVREPPGGAKPFKAIEARDVGWSVLDIDFSPDHNFIIYSSWSNFIHLCNVSGENEVHIPMDLQPTIPRHFCAFSIRLSPDTHEILAGTSEYAVYVYDIEKGKRTMRLQAHDDDINTVAFADGMSSEVFVSGSDDCLCKVWDRRCLGPSIPGQPSRPAGKLVGHTDGIVYIAPKGDGRQICTNAKDQTAKLFDLRNMGHRGIDSDDQPYHHVLPWDYRYNALPSEVVHPNHPNDQSVMTYRGHRVLQTLIRAKFSPKESTGQRYVYCGSHDGHVYIYDALTGALQTRLAHHMMVVRDVAWHPTLPLLFTTSWDGTHACFNYQQPEEPIPLDTVIADTKRRAYPGDDTVDHRRTFHPRVQLMSLNPDSEHGQAAHHPHHHGLFGGGSGTGRFTRPRWVIQLADAVRASTANTTISSSEQRNWTVQHAQEEEEGDEEELEEGDDDDVYEEDYDEELEYENEEQEGFEEEGEEEEMEESEDDRQTGEAEPISVTGEEVNKTTISEVEATVADVNQDSQQDRGS